MTLQISIVVEPARVVFGTAESQSRAEQSQLTLYHTFAQELEREGDVDVDVHHDFLRNIQTGRMILLHNSTNLEIMLRECDANRRAYFPSHTVLLRADRSHILETLEANNLAAAIESFYFFQWMSQYKKSNCGDGALMCGLSTQLD